MIIVSMHMKVSVPLSLPQIVVYNGIHVIADVDDYCYMGLLSIVINLYNPPYQRILY